MTFVAVTRTKEAVDHANPSADNESTALSM